MESETCFVLMPFTVKEIDQRKYPDPNHWNEVYEGLIVPAVDGVELRCERDDQDVGSRLIIENVLNKIEKAKIIICDLSSHNPNVFLELGWALRADKPFILIKDDLTIYNFDLNQQYIFDYNHSLQPTTLRKEILSLSDCIKRTVNDNDKRYSFVNRMSISISAINAFNKGDINTQLLMDIQQKLLNLPDISIKEKFQQDQFPWPDLLQIGMALLFNARKEIIKLENITDQNQIGALLNNLTSKLGFKRNKNIQISLIDSSRKFIYHDWNEIIGIHATHRGLGNKDIYDEIFNYPHGAVAWIDKLSNIPGYVAQSYLRYNIGLFTNIDEIDCKILVELHNEIT